MAVTGQTSTQFLKELEDARNKVLTAAALVSKRMGTGPYTPKCVKQLIKVQRELEAMETKAEELASAPTVREPPVSK